MLLALIATEDVGLAFQLETTLTKQGIECRHYTAGTPVGAADVVLLSAEEHGAGLVEVAQRFREQDTVPGIVVLGPPSAASMAAAARAPLVPPDAKSDSLVAAIGEAARRRFAADMNWRVARKAMGLPQGTGDVREAALIIARARKMEVDIPKAALKWHLKHYAQDRGAIPVLREARALSIPEVELAAHLHGCFTIQTLLKTGPLDPPGAARFLWALRCTGALELGPEPADGNTPERRALMNMRAHLRARRQRLEKATYFDVLEAPPAATFEEVERNYQLLAWRFQPDRLRAFDLGDMAADVDPNWQQIEVARAMFVDMAERGKYIDWVRENLPQLKTTWAVDPALAKEAAERFVRAQQALATGDIRKAMSELATACRIHPGHPEYEANLAWTRFRMQVGTGKDSQATAAQEREAMEQYVLGTRPWPRALVAHALLCAASGDATAAHFSLREALAVQPDMPAAKQLLSKLTSR